MESDKDFIAYCRAHSETERALFNGSQIGRLLKLAGDPHKTADAWLACPDMWVSADTSELCDTADALISALETKT